MTWLQLKAKVAPEQAERLEELLIAEGASAISLQDAYDDPVLEPELGTTPLWNETVLTGLYDDLDDVEAMIGRVGQAWAADVPDDPCPDISFELVADRDWEREWMDGYEPLQMGKRLWIVPSWHDSPDPHGVNLILDPGLAFGTGTHPTTALCLEWLDEQALAGRLDDQAILDIGCGSGILAIAALKLGATHAVGTDIDPQALTASRDNAERNEIDASRLSLYEPDTFQGDDYPIVLANILAGPLIEMAATLAGYVAPGGTIVLSGILAHQADDVADAYRDQGLMIDPPCERDGWVRLVGYRYDGSR
ncbi:50S ribosomal protein L11 methyltransferase [Aidingimonas lacisalsi]|uniref:50S ribosomal protein L11 methyltransferase n=1 Tax=Aidingimonas lacisalsi TaxID=2604086 RepID=UPI0011D1929E|nr:50S ribosomal protein L11 methyltransferase [Aidingimonas lacisalsi]